MPPRRCRSAATPLLMLSQGAFRGIAHKLQPQNPHPKPKLRTLTLDLGSLPPTLLAP